MQILFAVSFDTHRKVTFILRTVLNLFVLGANYVEEVTRKRANVTREYIYR